VVTRSQLRSLQSLYSLWRSRSIDDSISVPREARLKWASELTGRRVESFTQLTSLEAGKLIDALKGSLGQPLHHERPSPWRRIRSRDDAQSAGTDGRRAKSKPGIIRLAGPDDFARIDQALHRLGWTRENFEQWLHSDRSPLKGESPAVRTLADANVVWWALRSMLRRAGLWHQQHTSVARRA